MMAANLLRMFAISEEIIKAIENYWFKIVFLFLILKLSNIIAKVILNSKKMDTVHYFKIATNK